MFHIKTYDNNVNDILQNISWTMSTAKNIKQQQQQQPQPQQQQHQQQLSTTTTTPTITIEQQQNPIICSTFFCYLMGGEAPPLPQPIFSACFCLGVFVFICCVYSVAEVVLFMLFLLWSFLALNNTKLQPPSPPPPKKKHKNNNNNHQNDQNKTTKAPKTTRKQLQKLKSSKLSVYN